MTSKTPFRSLLLQCFGFDPESLPPSHSLQLPSLEPHPWLSPKHFDQQLDALLAGPGFLATSPIKPARGPSLILTLRSYLGKLGSACAVKFAAYSEQFEASPRRVLQLRPGDRWSNEALDPIASGQPHRGDLAAPVGREAGEEIAREQAGAPARCASPCGKTMMRSSGRNTPHAFGLEACAQHARRSSDRPWPRTSARRRAWHRRRGPWACRCP